MITPTFDFEKHGIGAEDIKADVEKCSQLIEEIGQNPILKSLLQQIQKIDFREVAEFTDDTEKLGKKHFLVCTIEHVLELAKANNWGLCKNHDFVYLFNGSYWTLLAEADLRDFLGEAAENMGIDKFSARFYTFRDELYKQFVSTANLPKPETPKDTVSVNLKNGTFDIGPLKQELREARRTDFITYQLPFAYDSSATCPLFQQYLDTVLPDNELQMILAEYIGYLFTNNLKLEKALLLYGTGANGKSVFFEIVSALLGGDENVSSYSLQNLTNENGYFRAKLANKLVNYASELNGKLEASIFKQLVSGEPVEARLPYGDPFTLYKYAKLIFNCNELPKEVEQSHAYFRRFLIVPFEHTIPEENQDRGLAKKIIRAELSGIFNWVLEGLKRILDQQAFTHSEAVQNQLELYKKQSDNVRMFLDDEEYRNSNNSSIPLREFYEVYSSYCFSNGYKRCSSRTFNERLKNCGTDVQRKNYGYAVYLTK
jgi:putative DNA primase/helicase